MSKDSKLATKKILFLSTQSLPSRNAKKIAAQLSERKERPQTEKLKLFKKKSASEN